MSDDELAEVRAMHVADPWRQCECCGDGCDCGCLEHCPLTRMVLRRRVLAVRGKTDA